METCPKIRSGLVFGMNEAYKSEFYGYIPVRGYIAGKGRVSDNPYQQVASEPDQRLGSNYSRGIPQFRFAGVPAEFLRAALRRQIGTDKDYLRERPYE